jgi:hypothetical protein
MASLTHHHGVNANLVRKWIPAYRDRQAPTLPAFVPLKLAPAVLFDFADGCSIIKSEFELIAHEKPKRREFYTGRIHLWLSTSPCHDFFRGGRWSHCKYMTVDKVWE